MTRQHKQTLERTMEVSFKHRRAATEMSTAVLGIEAMVASGIDTVTGVVENQDKKVLGRSISCLCHAVFGKRMADAISTIDKIIADESLTIVEQDKALTGAAHKAGLDKVVKDEITRRIEGKKVSSIVTKAEQAVDQLIVIYGTLLGPAGADGPKADAVTEANLAAIKVILDS